MLHGLKKGRVYVYTIYMYDCTYICGRAAMDRCTMCTVLHQEYSSISMYVHINVYVCIYSTLGSMYNYMHVRTVLTCVVANVS